MNLCRRAAIILHVYVVYITAVVYLWRAEGGQKESDLYLCAMNSVESLSLRLHLRTYVCELLVCTHTHKCYTLYMRVY